MQHPNLRRQFPPPPSLSSSTINPVAPLHLPSHKLTTGCAVLDRLLHGGIPCGSVTELAGECGAGKTQLCLQILLSSLRPPSPSASLYLYSEHHLPLRRLCHLSLPLSFPNPLDHILIGAVHSAEELLSSLSRASALLALSPSGLPIKLIVVDSIAALFRSDFDNTPTDLKKRSSFFFKISSKLKELAARFGAAVIVTNHVVDVVNSDGGGGTPRVGNSALLMSTGRRVSPALGLSWANCVNTRLFLSRTEEFIRNEEGVVLDVKTRRRIEVVFAPHLPDSSCEFVIIGDGVFGVG